RLPATNMVTSRGCPFDCSFCSKNVFGSYYRTQSPRRTVNEIKELIAQYRIREVAFSDDIFTVDRRRIVALCDLLLQDNVNICWSCNTRVDTVDRLLLRIMQRAGCVSIGYGIETASSQLLRQVAKGSVRAQAQEAIKCTKDAGIETRAFYMLAFPGETEKSIRDTIQLSIELDTDFTAYNFVVPFPGTQLYEYCKARHLLRYEGLELYDFLDGFHPLIKLDGIDPHQLVQLYNSAYRSYYFRATYLLNRFKKVRSLQDVRRYWEGLRSFMN
ncbi:MAG: B12-binding domain-containing radical SAM protein, partial [Candidatus Omnitrophica bacterium]|nr:B12-binding domain-containing radical SAM protein [Candidatus Omnitrophota bacterium]